MPIERFVCLVSGVALALAVLAAGPHHIPAPWDKAAHFAAYGLITALLWLGTEGRAPLAVPAAVIVLGGVDEVRQLFIPGRTGDVADFLTDVLAAASFAALLFFRGKRTCVESSQP
jgi:VanZ family protein